MDKPEAKPERPAYPRLNPQRLRTRPTPHETSIDIRSLLSDVAAPESAPPRTSKSAAEDTADYNPLGQFGAAWASNFSPKQPAEGR